MADQDWYAGDVYDDNQYDDDQQQQRQQPPADAAAATAVPAHTSTQPYSRGTSASRGRDNGARADIIGGARNTGRPAPTPGRDVSRGGSQFQSGRDRILQRDTYRGGDSGTRDWQHGDGKESARDYKDTHPRDMPRDAFRAEQTGLFREPHTRDAGGRAGFRDAPITRDGAFRDDPRDFHSGRDYRAPPQNFREPPASGYRQGNPVPRGDARDHGGYRELQPAQSQNFRDVRDAPYFRDQPPPREHHAFGGRGRAGDIYDLPGRSFGPVRDAHDDQHFPRDRRVEAPQPFRDSAMVGLDHRDHIRDGPYYRDSQSSSFRDHRDYSSHREAHPIPPQHDHRDISGHRDSVAVRASDAPARHVRDGPNYRESQPAGFRDQREYSGDRESHLAPYHKDGYVAVVHSDKERERDRGFIPRNRETSDVPACRPAQDQPSSDRNPRIDPSLQHQSLQSQNRPHSQQVPVSRDNVSSTLGDGVVSSTTVNQQHRNIEEHSLQSAVRDDFSTPNPALTISAGQIDKIEKPRFNQSEGRIYLGRVDWNTTKSDLVKFCEKYVWILFSVSCFHLTCF
jgi:hypothetical protein